MITSSLLLNCQVAQKFVYPGFLSDTTHQSQYTMISSLSQHQNTGLSLANNDKNVIGPELVALRHGIHVAEFTELKYKLTASFVKSLMWD